MKRDKKIDFRYNFKIYLSFLKKHKFMFFLLVLTAVIFQGLGIIDKLLFKYIIDSGTAFGAGEIAFNAFRTVLIIIALVWSGLVLIRAVSQWLELHFLIQLETKVKQAVKEKFFNHLISLSHQFHTTNKTGQMISRLIRGTNAVESFNDTIIFNFLPIAVKLIVMFITFAFFDVTAAFAVFFVSLVFIGFSLTIQRIQEPTNLVRNDTEDLEKAVVADMLTNVDSIKYFGKEDYVKRRFSKLALKTRQAQVNHVNIFRWGGSGHMFIIGLGTLLVLYSPVLGLLSGRTTLGDVAFIFAAYGSVTGALFSFVHGIRGFYRSMADMDVLFKYGKVENEVKDKYHAKNLRVTKGTVEFKDVAFAYPKRRVLFDKFNLTIDKNQKVALVGRSGSGKSTLIKLLYRLYDIDGGEILIDGKDISELKQELLRSELSIVPQECILFDDTIWNNIAFSRPGASKEEVRAAIKAAQLDELIKRLPNREQTIVGERGVKLSGGEKQRVSIARAILADKKLLILDEATSAMDSETEAKIQKALENLMKGRTTIIIAHRLSTILGADKIVVFENGKIAQQGTHNSLIRKPGQYKKLWNLQKGGYIK